MYGLPQNKHNYPNIISPTFSNYYVDNPLYLNDSEPTDGIVSNYISSKYSDNFLTSYYYPNFNTYSSHVLLSVHIIILY